MAHCWMHNGFVSIDKEKMSKSLGNFVTVQDVLDRNDPEGFRWFLLGVHYRGPVQFDTEKLADGRVVFPGVDEAERRVDYMYATRVRLDELLERGVTAPSKLPPEASKLRDAVHEALETGRAGLDDDLNTPVALASLGEMARLANELSDLAHKRRKDAAFVGAAAVVARSVQLDIDQLADELGLLSAAPGDYLERTRERRLRLRGLTVEVIDEKVAARTAARKAKDFARSDELRDELVALGIDLRDTPGGTDWTISV